MIDCLTDDPQELRKLETVLNRLAAYSGYRAIMLEMRRKGDMEAGIAYERCADEQYKKLPDWAKW